MEASCSFKPLVGGNCGFDPKDRKGDTRIVPLLACKKEISDHKTAFAFSGSESEVDLILSRAAVFIRPDNVDTWTICPYHRSKLGLGLTRGGNTRCRVPEEISKHQKTKGKWPRFERGIGQADSCLILKTTGAFVPPGSGMCIKCRKTLKELKDSDSRNTSPTSSSSCPKEPDLALEESVVEQMSNLSLDDSGEITFNPKFSTPSSLYEPSEASYIAANTEKAGDNPSPKEKLNAFLRSRDVSPIRHSLSIPWEQASERTKRFHTGKRNRL